MGSQALEQMLKDTFIPAIGQDMIYSTIDIYSVGTTALYTPPPKPFGLLTGQPFQFGYDLGGGYRLDFHGPNETILTHGHVKDPFGRIIKEYNGYECSMLDSILKDKFKRFP